MDEEAHKPWYIRSGLARPKLPIFLSLMTLVMVLGLSATALWEQQLKPPAGKSEGNEPPAVLGSRTGYSEPRIYVSDDKWGQNGGVISLAATDEPRVIINSYNVGGEVTVKVYRAMPQTLMAYLLVDKDGKQKNPTVDPTGLTEITTLKHTITKESNEEASLVLPLEGTGLWLLKISNDKIQTDAFVTRSNTGILTKEGDNEFIFWAQDFNTRRSAPGGKITLYSVRDSLQTLATAVVNDSGLATTSIRSEVDIGWYERGEDVALIPINLKYLNYGYNYDEFRPKERQVRYFVFTDRPLYRPGDTIYYKAVIRDDDDARYTVPGGTAKVEVYRGYGDEAEVIYSQDVPITGYGSVSGKVTLPENAKTDWYSVSVNAGQTQRPEDDYGYWPGGSTGVQVEYFRKPDYFLTVRSDKNEYIAGDEITYTVSGQYFFGQPLSNKKVTYEVRATNYYDYSYVQETKYYLNENYRYGGWYGESVTKGEATLDDQGNVIVKVPAKQKEGKSAVYSFTVHLSDETGTADEAAKNVLVYSGEFGIYRTNYEWGFSVGTPLVIPVKVVLRQGGGVANQVLNVKTTRKWWEKQPLKAGQKYATYLDKSETLPDQTLTTNNDGEASLTLTPTAGGSYEFKLSSPDKRGNMVTQTFRAWVSNQAQPMSYGVSEGELNVAVNKEKALPGEVVKVTLTSDIPDRDVFLSFERGRVNRYQIVPMQGLMTMVDVPIAETDMPNIFIEGASFSDDWLDTSQVDLPVVTDSRKLTINLTADKPKYGPGETATVAVKAQDGNNQPISAEIALWAVDKALFELVDQSNLDIFNAFWHERYNNTAQAHSLEGITTLTSEMGGCFAGGTAVLMTDHSTKPIEEVKPGDKVLTRAVDTDDLTAARVTAVHRVEVDGYWLINGTVKVTQNHKLWVNGWWREAGKIEIGDNLVNAAGQPVAVTSMAWQGGRETVYNLTVEGYHTFFASGVLAHNKGGEARTVFKDTAYWNPSVITDSYGNAQVSFKLPDNLTTWTIAAVGASAQTVVGDSKKDIMVTKEVIVRPALPNIMRVGDTLTLTAMVHNYTDTAHNFILALDFDAGEVSQASIGAMVIQPQEAKEAAWLVKPTKEKDKAKITIKAKAVDDPKAADTIVQTLPVYPFGFGEQTGEAAIGNKTYSIQLAVDADPKRSTVTLALTPTLLGTLPKAMSYLVDYPYGCVEQTTSRLVPVIIAGENSRFFAAALEGKDLKQMVAEGMKLLTELQNSDGGWSWWWAGTNSSDPFVSAYVSEFLVRARANGYEVPQTLLDNARRFFEATTYETKDGKDRGLFIGNALVAKRYALMFLKPSEKIEPVTDFNQITVDLLPWAIAVNLKAGLTDTAANGVQRLIGLAKNQGDGMYWDAGDKLRYGSADATTALALKALIEAKYERTELVKIVRYLVRSRNKHYWSNTFATANVADALTAYAKTGSETSPNYQYSVKLNNQTLAEGKVTSLEQKIPDIAIPLNKLGNQPGQLAVAYTGDGQLYSTLLTDTFHTDKQAPAVANGMLIEREYVSDKGAGYSLGLGDTVTVRLTLSGLGAEEYYGIIKDELPAGLTPINTTFKNEQANQNTRGRYFDGGSGFDITENGMVISLYSLSPGSHIYTYKARVINAGTYTVPPVTASLMYAPEINARSAAEVVTVDQEAQFDAARAARASLLTGIGKEALQKRPWWQYGLIAGSGVLVIGLGAGVYWWWKRRKKKVVPPIPPPLPPSPPQPPLPQPQPLPSPPAVPSV
jgi:uncharacterized protein YfaS (alpha-2-macroglobulin family)